MKFSISSEELSSKLGLVTRVLSTGGVNPALGGVLVTAEEGRLSFSATDGNMSLRAPVHVTAAEGEGRLLVPGRLFADISRLLGSGTATLGYSPAERLLAIDSGSSSFRIRVLSDEDFPPLPEAAGDAISLSREALLEAIDLVARAASKDDMRPVLTSVEMIAEGDVLTLVATDSYRLAVKKTQLPEAVSSDLDRNVPAQALRELSRLLGSSSDEMVRVSGTDREVIFAIEGIVLSSTTVDGQFPPYSKLFPETWEHNIRLPRVELLESVRRVSQLAQKNRPLRVSLTAGELTISAETPELGSAEEKMPAQYEGDELSIGFNHEYFRDGIEAVPGDELLLRLISPLRPGMIEPIEDKGFRYLVMPVRLPE